MDGHGLERPVHSEVSGGRRERWRVERRRLRWSPLLRRRRARSHGLKTAVLDGQCSAAWRHTERR
jgi:hypothetical protein